MSGVGYTETVIFLAVAPAAECRNLARIWDPEGYSDSLPTTDPSHRIPRLCSATVRTLVCISRSRTLPCSRALRQHEQARVGGAVKREELLVALSNKIREVSCRTVAAIDPHHFGRGTQ